jgi:predicted anti-sigma-YlaC factor YlaD
VLGLFKNLVRRHEIDCEGVRELSSDYLEEDLPTAKRSTIQSHLSKCRPCQAFVDTLASTISILASLPRVSPPASFKRSILARAKQDKGQSPS